MIKHPAPMNHYEALLLGYAAGLLDEAQTLIMAAHLSLSHKAQQFLKYYEAIGGHLIAHECEPIAMSGSALNRVLTKLDTPAACDEEGCCECDFPAEITLPPLLARTVAAQEQKAVWHRMMPGMETLPLELACRRSKAHFLKADPGVKSPPHRHSGMEIMLVLNGAFSDQGDHYHRGDLCVKNARSAHAPEACKNEGCICLVVSSAPVQLTGIAALLNPFIRV